MIWDYDSFLPHLQLVNSRSNFSFQYINPLAPFQSFKADIAARIASNYEKYFFSWKIWLSEIELFN